MYNLYKAIKAFSFILLCSLMSINSGNACIDAGEIIILSETDNGAGSFTYDITFTLSIFTTATFADLEVSAGNGSISNCNGGSCDNFAVSPGMAITATVTKNSGPDLELNLKGLLSNGSTVCLIDNIVFTGLESLPAELVLFQGEAKDRGNNLIWQTASEENTLAFQVERSLDGRNFEAIGRIDAAGNSTDLESYEYIDESPISLSYYRLKVVDIDGYYEYSEVVLVERTKPEIDMVEVFPVPVVDEEVTVLVHTRSDGAVFMDLFDMTGRVLQQERLELSAGVNRMVLDLKGEVGNMYFITIYNGDERISKTILKSNLD